MCTVTIIPNGNNNFVLTSNRDEAPNRISNSPDFYDADGVKMLFPKDELSGGTWIGVSEKERLVCVLNGGFTSHQRQPYYRKSRGIVAKDFMAFDDLEKEVASYHFYNIEPFTMVIVDWNTDLKFFELVWDGTKAHFKTLPLEPHIWSSSTLYSETMKQERFNWFETFKSQNELHAKSILQFHKTAGNDNLDYVVVMNRGFVKKTSITQVEKRDGLLNMLYENLQNHTITNKQFKLHKTVNE